MKLSNLAEASSLKDQMAELTKKLAMINDPAHMNCLGITVQGTYQDEEMVAACKAAVVSELSRRRDLIIARLRELGVTDV